MFRENILTQDAFIDRIASTMVPVALRWPEAKEKLVTFDALVEWILEAP